MFQSSGRACGQVEKGNEELEVLANEIEQAMQKLKNTKAAEIDGILAEAIKEGGRTLVKALKEAIHSVWTSGAWPEE